MDEHTAQSPQTADSRHTPVTLGGYIREARERAGFSFRNLEAITGISRATIQRLELDQVDNPTPSMLHRIAEALELDSDDLFAFLGYRPSEKLPSLVPYLRTKYNLPPAALTKAHQALRDILDQYDRAHESKPPSAHGSRSNNEEI